MNNNYKNMKKQSIVMISVIVVLLIAIGCFFLNKKNNSQQNNNLNPQIQEQNNSESGIASLLVGNWVSVSAEKSNGLYAASMIMVCDSKDSCLNNKTPNNMPSSENIPTGPSPAESDGNRRISDDMANKTMLSGTITQVNSDNIVLTLDTGETATITISDTTKINKR